MLSDCFFLALLYLSVYFLYHAVFVINKDFRLSLDGMEMQDFPVSRNLRKRLEILKETEIEKIH
jgi:hypothetical protein